MDEHWAHICNLKCRNGAQRFPLLSKIIRTILTIPNSNADSERMFSGVKKIHTAFRSQLNNDTICQLLAVKTNCDDDCYNLTTDSELLKKAKSATWNYIQEQKNKQSDK